MISIFASLLLCNLFWMQFSWLLHITTFSYYFYWLNINIIQCSRRVDFFVFLIIQIQTFIGPLTITVLFNYIVIHSKSKMCLMLMYPAPWLKIRSDRARVLVMHLWELNLLKILPMGGVKSSTPFYILASDSRLLKPYMSLPFLPVTSTTGYHVHIKIPLLRHENKSERVVQSLKLNIKGIRVTEQWLRAYTTLAEDRGLEGYLQSSVYIIHIK